MPAERYFSDQQFSINQSIDLLDNEFHHLIHVMRGAIGGSIELINGRGQLAKATIQKIEKKRVVLHLEHVEIQNNSSVNIILAQSIPKMNRLDFILEKGTELGMTEIWLFPSDLGEKKKLSEHQIQRLSNLTIAAMKQSGRLYIPKIVIMPPLTQWSQLPYSAFFGDTKTDAPSLISLLKKPLDNLMFFVGPESGFSADEILHLHNLNAQGVKLHPNILRTDTAGIAALAVISMVDIS